MTLSIIPTNSLFAGDGITRWATRWLTVAAVLQRPNGNTIEACRVERSRERVRRRGASLNGWGSRGDTGLALKPPVAEVDGREGLDGRMGQCQLST